MRIGIGGEVDGRLGETQHVVRIAHGHRNDPRAGRQQRLDQPLLPGIDG
ncbi:hypothetical protein [Streptomyces sp. NPDC056165]